MDYVLVLSFSTEAIIISEKIFFNRKNKNIIFLDIGSIYKLYSPKQVFFPNIETQSTQPDVNVQWLLYIIHVKYEVKDESGLFCKYGMPK